MVEEKRKTKPHRWRKQRERRTCNGRGGAWSKADRSLGWERRGSKDRTDEGHTFNRGVKNGRKKHRDSSRSGERNFWDCFGFVSGERG